MPTTWIRTAVLAVLALVGLLFPGLIPEGAREVIARNAEAAVGAVLALWAIFAGLRARKQQAGEEAP
jgi:hypothetical protein